jgi:hypothetical protein
LKVTFAVLTGGGSLRLLALPAVEPVTKSLANYQARIAGMFGPRVTQVAFDHMATVQKFLNKNGHLRSLSLWSDHDRAREIGCRRGCHHRHFVGTDPSLYGPRHDRVPAIPGGEQMRLSDRQGSCRLHTESGQVVGR